MSIPGLAIPGLGSSAGGPEASVSQSAEAEVSTRHQNLAAKTEYRFEVPFSRTVRIKSVTGIAELFGTELAPNRQYSFSGVKAAIYTPHGCLLEIEGQPENDYVGEETEMVVAVNLHFALEDMRDRAQATDTIGPRVLLVGPDNTGKTTMMRILASYALRMGRQPTLVNLDTLEGMLSVPGSFTTATLNDILDIEEAGGWGSTPITGPSAIPVKMPLVYHYGRKTGEENKSTYKALVTRLALAVTSRLEDDKDSKNAGFFVDTSGSISSGKRGSYDLIQHIVSEFSIDNIIVLGSERLYQDMRRLFSANTESEDAINVVKVAKSEGCVDRDETFMRQYRQAQIRDYFFGPPHSPLSPYTMWADFSQVTIFKIFDHSRYSHSSFNPGGEDDDYDPGASLIYQRVAPSNALQGSLLAITTADVNESQDAIRDSSIQGYIYIAEVDETKSKMRLLTPMSGRVPSKALVVGDWPEGVVDMT